MGEHEYEYEWQKPKPADCPDCRTVQAQSAGYHLQCAACDAKDFMQRTEDERREHAARQWERRQAEGFIRADAPNPYRRS